MKISTVAEMMALDQTAVKQFGIKEELLMENAGLAVYQVMAKTTHVKSGRFVVFCGLGNNGGDGFVVARKLHSNGARVKVYILGDPGKFKGVAKLNLDIVSRLPIDIERVEDIRPVKYDLAHCDGIVDAIFGTGLTRAVEGIYAQVIRLINASGKTVYAVDIPSGVQGDSGQVLGTAVQAHHTVTFGLPKIGSVLYPGYDLCGELYVTHISFPSAMYAADTLKLAFNDPILLPPRNPDGHKGAFGQALFIAGAASYYGAPYFAAMSFLKAGGGYSRLAAPRSITPFIANKGSEIVFIPMQETASGSIALKNKQALLGLADKMDLVILGPGLSLDPETQQLARELVEQVKTPLVLDGDGITALCDDLEIIRNRKSETVLTPHLGEMSRMTGIDAAKIAADKITVLRQAADNLRAHIVLKGAHSLIGMPDGRVFVNMSGNAGMATAGSGDVLTGAIAAMQGLGLSFEDAVRNGVFVHGLAGDLAAEDMGGDGITAQTLLDYLPFAMDTLRGNWDEVFLGRYHGVPVIL
jgi:ADP-dependent NAD(P)H-hydrate dehydratase / NAD(P)H-hydrate epimerase